MKEIGTDCFALLIILIIWSVLVWSAGQDLEWDEAVITLIPQTDRQTSDRQTDRVFLFCTVIEAFLRMA